MSGGSYLLVSIFCFLLILIMGFAVYSSYDRRHEMYIFSQILVCISLLILFDTLCAEIELGCITLPVEYSFSFHVIRITVGAALSSIWMIYSEFCQDRTFVDNKKNLLFTFMMIPLVCLTAIMSYETHIWFYIDESGKFIYGPSGRMLMVLPYLCSVYATIHAFANGCKRENFANRRFYFTLAGFMLFPVLAIMSKLIWKGIPATMIGNTLGTVTVFIYSRDALISRDPLTQLNNRGQFLKDIVHRFRLYSEKHGLCLIIMDADNFKTINDTYGHNEGDYALVTVAECLKSVASTRECSIYRYGGDEFVMLSEAANIDEVLEICGEIRECLKKHTRGNKKPYDITLSIGYAVYRPGEHDIQSLIAEADKLLYIEKKYKKNKFQSA